MHSSVPTDKEYRRLSPAIPRVLPSCFSHRGAPGAYRSGVYLNDHAHMISLNLVQKYWDLEMERLSYGVIDTKNHALPLARIKKVMKGDPDVKQMISSEAPLIFSKASELFVSELTLRAWGIAEENKRRTLQRADVVAATTQSDIYDFLIDILHREADETLLRSADAVLEPKVYFPPMRAPRYGDQSHYTPHAKRPREDFYPPPLYQTHPALDENTGEYAEFPDSHYMPMDGSLFDPDDE